MGNYHKSEYHEHDEAWERRPRNLVGDHVGIELEIDYGHNGDARDYDILNALPTPRGKNSRNLKPATEDDGSLSGRGSVEIIFPPLPVHRVLGNKTFFRRAVETMKKELPTYNGHENAGMHISLNINGWEENLIKAMILAFNHLPRVFIETIGGRELTGYCQQYNGAYNDEDYFDGFDFDGDDDEEDLCQCGSCRSARGEEIADPNGRTDRIVDYASFNHDAIVNREGPRLEFRYPASSLNMDLITRNIAFIYYVRDYLQRELESSKLVINTTQEGTFGKPEELQRGIVRYIVTRRKSKKRDLIMEVLNARTNRRQAA